MKQLIFLEWLKWRRHTTFRVLMSVYLVLLPVSLLLTKQLKHLPPPFDTAEAFLIFPNVWQYLGFVANWMTYFCFGLFAVFSITTEFNNRTVRQNIITGLSRRDFFRAKFFFMLTISFSAALYYGIWVLLIGYWHTDLPIISKVLERSNHLYQVWLASVGYMSLGLLIGLLVRRTGLATVLYLSYTSFIELTLRWGLHFNLSPTKSVHFYPTKAFADLSPFPMLEMAESFLKQYQFAISLSPVEAVVISIFTFLYLMHSFTEH